MLITIEDRQHAAYQTALGMLRRGKCGADVIVGYLEYTLNRAAEARS